MDEPPQSDLPARTDLFAATPGGAVPSGFGAGGNDSAEVPEAVEKLRFEPDRGVRKRCRDS
jgi:hypothetical protein